MSSPPQPTQLIPDTLAVAVKESVSGSTSAGTGATGVINTGVGMGAAGAGGGTGGVGDVVMAFDTDHETPELIWNAVSRHELRCAMGELINGLVRRVVWAGGGCRKKDDNIERRPLAPFSDGSPPPRWCRQRARWRGRMRLVAPAVVPRPLLQPGEGGGRLQSVACHLLSQCPRA